MDVRRALLHRPLQDQVDQADHRRFGSHVLEVFDIFQRAALLIEVLDQGTHGGTALAVIALDQRIDFVARADGQPYRHIAGVGQGLKGIVLRRVGREDAQPALGPPHRHHLVMAHKALGERGQRVEQRRRGIGQQQRRAEQRRPGAGQFDFGHQPQACEQPQQVAGVGGQAPGALQINSFQPGVLHQPRAHGVGVRYLRMAGIDGHGRHSGVSSCEKVWLFGTTGYKNKMPLVRHAAVGVNWVNRLKVPTLVPEAGKQTEKNSLRPP